MMIFTNFINAIHLIGFSSMEKINIFKCSWFLLNMNRKRGTRSTGILGRFYRISLSPGVFSTKFVAFRHIIFWINLRMERQPRWLCPLIITYLKCFDNKIFYGSVVMRLSFNGQLFGSNTTEWLFEIIILYLQ